MATELFRSVRPNTDVEKLPLVPVPPPAFAVGPSPSLCCLRKREATEEEEEDEPSPMAVGVVKAELGGLWEECLSEEMSTVGEGREEIGVSMVEGRGIDSGFARSSLLPLEISSVDRTSK